jgi:hypothetical protein
MLNFEIEIKLKITCIYSKNSFQKLKKLPTPWGDSSPTPRTKLADRILLFGF